MTAEYRITTNGHEFRIEQKGQTFWRRREVWLPLTATSVAASGNWYDNTQYIRTYASMEHAEASLRDIIKEKDKHFAEWKPV